MNRKINIQSALLGLGIGVLLTLLVAAAPSPGSVGRFQITGAGNHALIIDTATGRVWQAYMPSGEGATDADFFQSKLDQKK